MQDLIGQSVGRYRLDSLLGEGGMGSVYKGMDVTLQRAVAVKLMHAQYSRDGDFQKRFLNEARTAAQLDNPNIVKVLDFGSTPTALYIVMEFLPGDNLRKMLKNLAAKQQWIALPEALNLTRQICLTLGYIHQHGILHRDIKPENIMLKPEPSDGLPYRPVITDLGLARLLTGDHLTEQGVSMGTMPYMSPEQAQGLETDARTDVYAIGVLLYELAVGRLPFEVRTLTEAIRYHTQVPPPPPRSLHPELPESVERIILRALEKDPANRFQTAGAMAEALAGINIKPIPTATLISSGGSAAVVGMSSLMTVHNAGGPVRGDSVLADFPSPDPGMRQDRIGIIAPNKPIQYMLMKPQGLTIGRVPGVDVVLDDEQISRRHAQINFDGTDYFVTDLKSTNGTYMANFKLLPNVAQKWTPDKPLRLGRHYLRLERSSGVEQASELASPAAPQGTQLPKSSAPKNVGVFMEENSYAVTPGSVVILSLSVINQSEVVDHYNVEVTGIPQEWYGGAVPPVQLLPGEQRPVTVSIQPPRAAKSQAGLYSLRIRVVSQDTPAQFGEVKASLMVSAFHMLNSALAPERVTAGKPSQVHLRNMGNAPETINLKWSDPANTIRFTPGDARVVVAPGEESAVQFTAAPQTRRWIGGEKQYPYVVQVAPVSGEALTQRGQVVDSGLVPVWLPPLAAVLGLLLCGLLYALLVKPPTIQSVGLDTVNPQPGQPVNILWNVTNCSRVDVWNGATLLASNQPCIGAVAVPGGFQAPPNVYITASNMFAPIVSSATRVAEIGLITPTPRPTATATPTAEPKAPVIELWVVEPDEIVEGSQVTLRWKVSNADTVVIQPFGTQNNEGELTDKPRQPRTYTLLASNKDKNVQRSLDVFVMTPTPTLNFAATDSFVAGQATQAANAAQQTASARQIAGQQTAAAATQQAQIAAAQAAAAAAGAQAATAAAQSNAQQTTIAMQATSAAATLTAVTQPTTVAQIVSLTDAATSAQWFSCGLLADGNNCTGTVSLAVNGSAGDSNGFVIVSAGQMEDGTTTTVLRTHPKWVTNGSIKGFFKSEMVNLTSNARFRAQVGFLKGATGTDGVTFWVWEHHFVNGSETWSPIARVFKTYTGSLQTIDVDLSALAGRDTYIELRVDAGTSSGQDWAAWVKPEIVLQ